MFKENPAANEQETIIGPSVKVEGDFVTEGNIIIEGTVCGTIKTSSNLKAGEKSKIFANIWAENALLSGEIQGNIKVNQKLELTPSAKIYGDIRSATLIVAPGSVINGRCQMTDAKEKSTKPEFSRQEKIDLKTMAELAEDKGKNKAKK